MTKLRDKAARSFWEFCSIRAFVRLQRCLQGALVNRRRVGGRSRDGNSSLKCTKSVEIRCNVNIWGASFLSITICSAKPLFFSIFGVLKSLRVHANTHACTLLSYATIYLI